MKGFNRRIATKFDTFPCRETFHRHTCKTIIRRKRFPTCLLVLRRGVLGKKIFRSISLFSFSVSFPSLIFVRHARLLTKIYWRIGNGSRYDFLISRCRIDREKLRSPMRTVRCAVIGLINREKFPDEKSAGAEYREKKCAIETKIFEIEMTIIGDGLRTDRKAISVCLVEDRRNNDEFNNQLITVSRSLLLFKI